VVGDTFEEHGNFSLTPQMNNVEMEILQLLDGIERVEEP